MDAKYGAGRQGQEALQDIRATIGRLLPYFSSRAAPGPRLAIARSHDGQNIPRGSKEQKLNGKWPEGNEGGVDA